MLTIGERVKYLRKEVLGLTQENFAEKLNFARSSIARIEKGDILPLDRTILDICREFNISEDWLRYGNGEIFVPKSTSLLDELTFEYNLNSVEKSIIDNFINSNDKERNIFLKYLKNLTSSSNNSDVINALINENINQQITVLQSNNGFNTLLINNVNDEQLALIRQILTKNAKNDDINVYKIARSQTDTPPSLTSITKEQLKSIKNAKPLSEFDDL